MPSTQAVEVEPKRGRPRNPEAPKFLLLRLPRELHQKMKEQAAADGLELTAWIRLGAIEKLRRKKAAA
jgi:predicted HicB family RNase H-like nuclease